MDDFTSMFPLYELLSHAELTKPRPVSAQAVEARRSTRHPRHGRVTLFPRVERPEPVDPLEGKPTILAALSNISTDGLGLIHSDEMPEGLEFDMHWEEAGSTRPLRFRVVYSRQTSGGMFRSGAKLVAGVLPAEPAPQVIFTAPPMLEMQSNESHVHSAAVDEAIEAAQTILKLVSEAVASDSSTDSSDEDYSDEPQNMAITSMGVLKFEAPKSETKQLTGPTPPGTFSARSAFGFDKTEKLDGVTTCGWERSVEIKRVGDKMWIYIHSPGKKNGWGIFVDAKDLNAAMDRINEAAESPFITTLAA